jgi:hypothetical protein
MTGLMTARAQHPRTFKAWIAVATIPIGFVVSMVVGEGIISMLGYEPDDEDPPAGALALAGGAGIAVFLVPCVAAWVLGRRAQASGEPQGNAPALVGAMVGAAFVALNLVGVVGRILGL